jgi:hypothetical protein
LGWNLTNAKAEFSTEVKQLHIKCKVTQFLYLKKPLGSFAFKALQPRLRIRIVDAEKPACQSIESPPQKSPSGRKSTVSLGGHGARTDHHIVFRKGLLKWGQVVE